jgi:predicted ATPase
LAVSLTNAARLLSFTGNDAALEEWAVELATMASEQGFLLWRATGIIFRGWVSANTGDIAEGISLLHRGSAAYRATGAQAWVPYQIALLARAYEIAGQIEQAVELLDDSLQIVERTGERWFAAELNRHKGKFCCGKGKRGTPKNYSTKPLASPRSRRPSFGNCAPP